MNHSANIGRLAVAPVLSRFVEEEALPGTGIEPARFWSGLESLLGRFGERNAALLARRDALQARIDAWWIAHRGQPFDVAAHTAFLKDIGYL
ncbi:malate synthase G, partial [bacterium]